MKTLKSISIILLFTFLVCSCDKNEFAPEIYDQEFTVEENSGTGSIIGVINASDADEGQVVTFEIIDGNSSGTFMVDPETGILSVADPEELDYEKNTEMIITVAAADNHTKEPLESSAKIKINITDKNEFAPVIKTQSFTINENPFNGQEIGAIIASDGDIHQHLIYNLSNSESAEIFELDSNSGTLMVRDSAVFDFETNQKIMVEVQVRDDHENYKTDLSTIEINIIDVQEITDGLIFYVPFNGNSQDESGNNILTEDIGPFPAEDRFGNANSAYYFDGISNYIRLNSNNPLITTKAFTISIWAKMNGQSQAYLSSNSLFEQRDDTDGGAPVYIHFNADQDGETRFALRSSESIEHVIVSATAPEYGSWHHYVAKIDEQKNMHLYIDGVLKASGVFINDGDFNTLVDRVSIGAHHPSGMLTGAFNGVLDEILVHSRALSEEEIEMLFESTAPIIKD